MTVPPLFSGPSVPPPPPGPGVDAPFATPPTERDRKRVWIGLGVGAALVVLCCGGGVFGFGALVVNRTDALRGEAVSVVRQYLTDLGAERYASAYRLLCERLRGGMSLTEYVAGARSRPRVTNFTIGSPSINTTGAVVPAEVYDAEGGIRHPTFELVEEQQPGALRICGGE